MLDLWRGMPNGVRIVLVFGFPLLAVVGLTLPIVVSQAVEAPISPSVCCGCCCSLFSSSR